ncbi:unnamed protein product, partial [Mesorhabditis belari]|uniref:DUF8206 domain-containing protein n=1 Tax=Mesorhabditis belari TaxID=2138241 RepID=A0AAF3J4C1_9BILA
MGPLKAYFNELKEKEGLSVRIDDGNIFCLDNEAFRFVCAHFCDIQFDIREVKTFGDSWKHSSDEVQRLLDHAARARPHHTSDTLSINDTRTWIYQLIDPILKACTMIQRNLQQLDWQKKELMQAENNVEELRRLATIRVTSIEILQLSMPQTVCRSQKCARYERIDGKEALIYRVCHKDCKLSDIGKLDGCAVFHGCRFCTECSCHINDHERISYEQRMTTKSLENPQKLASDANAAEMKKTSIRKIERLINGYQKESNYILFAMTTF